MYLSYKRAVVHGTTILSFLCKFEKETSFNLFSSLFLEFIEAFMRLNSVPRGRGPFGQSLQNSMLRKKDQNEGN